MERVPEQVRKEFLTKDIQDMTHSDMIAFNKLYNIKRNSTLSEGQKQLLEKIGADIVNEICKKNIEQVTYGELCKILNVVNVSDTSAISIDLHPIESTVDYQYGWQRSNKCDNDMLYYIMFYDLWMVDIDNANTDLIEIENILLDRGYSGRIYSTYNGYHIFITSKRIDHHSRESKCLMDLLKGDVYYKYFTYRTGFSVRLSLKKDREETIASTFLRKFGNSEDPDLVKLLTYHDLLLDKHKNTININ